MVETPSLMQDLKIAFYESVFEQFASTKRVKPHPVSLIGGSGGSITNVHQSFLNLIVKIKLFFSFHVIAMLYFVFVYHKKIPKIYFGFEVQIICLIWLYRLLFLFPCKF